MADSISIIPTNSPYQQHIQELIGERAYVRIWFWLNKPKDYRTAATYVHVAIEAFPNGRHKASEYMSFWSRSHSSCSSCNIKEMHFHMAKSTDDDICGSATSLYYDLPLDVQIVCRAFSKFKNNPKAWGSLGWHVFTRRPSFDAPGLSIYLLQKGKISDFAPPTHSLYSASLRFIGQSATCFGIFSNIAAMQIQLVAEMPSNVERYNRGFTTALGMSLFAKDVCQKTMQATQKMMPFDDRGDSQQILAAADSAHKYLSRIFSGLDSPKLIIIPSLKQALSSLQFKIWCVSAMTFLVGLSSFGLYFVGRYFSNSSNFVDVERLTQQAVEGFSQKASKEKKTTSSL
jgi:hypothetical protein